MVAVVVVPAVAPGAPLAPSDVRMERVEREVVRSWLWEVGKGAFVLVLEGVSLERREGREKQVHLLDEGFLGSGTAVAVGV